MSEAIIFIGIQASGKSTFYRERFFRTHLRVNLDMLKTRHREQKLIEYCIDTRLSFVVDNTNPTRIEREKYIRIAKSSCFSIIGYFFQSQIQCCLERNNLRSGIEKIPEIGVRGVHSKLEMPIYSEGFDKLHFVKINPKGGFLVSPWVINSEI